VLAGVAVLASDGSQKAVANNESQRIETSNIPTRAVNAGASKIATQLPDVCYIQFCRQRHQGGGLVNERCTNVGTKPTGCCTYDCVVDASCTDLTCPPLVCSGECP
jgi:hypothetical protein